MGRSKKILKEFLKDLTKVFGYPFFGNLSSNLKSDLENKVTKEWFDAEKATEVSTKFNIFLYPLLLGTERYYNYYLQEPSLYRLGQIFAISFLYGTSLALFEGYFRERTMKRIKKSSYLPGSLAGKIVSIPIDYVLDLYKKSA